MKTISFQPIVVLGKYTKNGVNLSWFFQGEVTQILKKKKCTKFHSKIILIFGVFFPDISEKTWHVFEKKIALSPMHIYAFEAMKLSLSFMFSHVACVMNNRHARKKKWSANSGKFDLKVYIQINRHHKDSMLTLDENYECIRQYLPSQIYILSMQHAHVVPKIS